ncbi:small EDRK-rich factor 2 isoform X1 [Genypterus blacodes]|uniref:small EDRK-rich factor 2 isoform X1 n=1 Tax=Genypterus blacodes TaxID=154954 RepID=UPI003F7663F5
MTRGNQRELARAKNAKKQNDGTKGKRGDDGLSAAARKQRDAEIMKEKQKKADGTGKAPDPPK